MDHATRNEAIRALAAASAAWIRINPRRAVAALRPVAGEIVVDEPSANTFTRCTDRDLPIERQCDRSVKLVRAMHGETKWRPTKCPG